MEKTDKLKLVIESDEGLANAIRRSVNKVPILAINEVEIHKNDSALYDEILSHRIGLIPIKSKRKLDEIQKDDKKTSKNQIHITLKSKGPAIVYSKEFKGDIEMVYGNIPITILDKDQELELIGYAQLGIGEEHAKFSPGLAYFRNTAEIKIKDIDKAKPVIEKIKNSVIKGSVKQGEIIISDEAVDYIESLIDENNEIEVSPGKDIVFFIESWGQLKAKEIFQEAIKTLNKNLKEVLKVIK